MAHTIEKAKLSKKDVDEHLKKLRVELSERYQYEDGGPDVKIAEREEELASGAWEVKCSCGWTGNNPLQSEEAADDASEYHLATMYPESV